MKKQTNFFNPNHITSNKQLFMNHQNHQRHLKGSTAKRRAQKNDNYSVQNFTNEEIIDFTNARSGLLSGRGDFFTAPSQVSLLIKQEIGRCQEAESIERLAHFELKDDDLHIDSVQCGIVSFCICRFSYNCGGVFRQHRFSRTAGLQEKRSLKWHQRRSSKLGLTCHLYYSWQG